MNHCLFLILVGLSLQAVEAGSDQEAIERFKRFVQDCRQTLDQGQILDVNQLREFVSRANDGFNVRIPSSGLSEFSIVNGIWYLINNRQTEFAHSKKGRKEYEARFDKHVTGTCMAVTSKLSPIMSDYHRLVESQEALRYLDADSLDWLATSRICFHILDNPLKFRKRVYEKVVGMHFHTTWFGRTFHKLAEHV